MLLMAARSATMWLNATLCTIYLSEHCMRGWTRFLGLCLWVFRGTDRISWWLFHISISFCYVYWRYNPTVEPSFWGIRVTYQVAFCGW